MTGQAAEWHEKRREGVGGSDIAGIFGLSAWKQPWEIYRLKVGLDQPDPGSAAAARGSALETEVIRRFEEDSGMQVTEGVDFLRHPLWPRIRIQANTDGTITGSPPGLFEAKTTSRRSRSAEAFHENVIPTWYATQVQGYLAATGFTWGVIAALLGPSDTDRWLPDQCSLIALRFERNDYAIQLIEEVVEEFWTCVDNRTPPHWHRHPLAQDLVSTLHHTPLERLV